MRQLFAICFLAFIISHTQAIVCDKYVKKIQLTELEYFKNIIPCIYKKTGQGQVENLIKGEKSLEVLEKEFQDARFECFQEAKNPSKKIKDLFQCYKNYYEAKFDTTVNVPTLEDQQKGTNSKSWNDKDLEQKIEEEHQERKSTTNVALYIFCVVLGIAILALLIAILFSKYRMHVNKESAALGQSSMEFGASNSNYQKQTDF